MSDRRFNGEIERLRSPERVERSEPARVVALCLDGIEAANALDIGTGSGLFAEHFHKAGLAVAGADVNPQMVEAAARFVPGGDFRRAPAEALPWPDRAFDLTFMACLLHEVDDCVRTLKEARRTARRRVAVLEFPKIEQPFGPPLHHRLSDRQIRDCAQQAGLPAPAVHPLTHLVLYIWDLDR